MPSRDIVEAFAKRLEDGDFVGAILDYYTPDAATHENQAEPLVGRDKLAAWQRFQVQSPLSARACQA